MERGSFCNGSLRKPDEQDNGVLFKNGQKSIKFYDKSKIDPSPEAVDLLRQEITLKNTNQIGRVLGIKEPILLDVTTTAAEKALNRELQVIGLDRCVIASKMPLSAVQESISRAIKRAYSMRWQRSGRRTRDRFTSGKAEAGALRSP
jgi:hypothetical protein